MSLIDFIEKLRQKPRYVRMQIMWLIVAVCMIFIFIVWLWSLGNEMNLAQTQTPEQKGVLENLGQLKEDIPTLWQSLGAGISNVFNSVDETINKSAPSESAVPSATPTPLPKQTLPTE